MRQNWIIRDVTPADMAAITEIYNYYILETDITFDTQIQSVEEKTAAMQHIKQHSPYLVAEVDGQVVGYAYAMPWHEMPAYAHTFESTIYLSSQRDTTRLRGLGTALYQALLTQLAAQGKVHVLFGVPTVGNRASERLHEKLGFQHVATFKAVGRKFDRWLDIHYYAYYFKTE